MVLINVQPLMQNQKRTIASSVAELGERKILVNIECGIVNVLLSLGIV